MIMNKRYGPATSSKTAYIDRLQEHRSRQRKVVQHDLSDESLSFA